MWGKPSLVSLFVDRTVWRKVYGFLRAKYFSSIRWHIHLHSINSDDGDDGSPSQQTKELLAIDLYLPVPAALHENEPVVTGAARALGGTLWSLKSQSPSAVVAAVRKAISEAELHGVGLGEHAVVSMQATCRLASHGGAGTITLRSDPIRIEDSTIPRPAPRHSEAPPVAWQSQAAAAADPFAQLELAADSLAGPPPQGLRSAPTASSIPLPQSGANGVKAAALLVDRGLSDNSVRRAVRSLVASLHPQRPCKDEAVLIASKTSIKTTGSAAGHCAIIAALRCCKWCDKLGHQLPPSLETTAVGLARLACVCLMMARCLSDPGGYATLVRSEPADLAGYLQGQLWAGPCRLRSQFAGPHELCALAKVLQTHIAMLAERGSENAGLLADPAAWPGADIAPGGAGAAPAPLAIIINSRRSHTFPVTVVGHRPLLSFSRDFLPRVRACAEAAEAAWAACAESSLRALLAPVMEGIRTNRARITALVQQTGSPL